MTTVTQWFPPNQKPVHPGVYELRGLPFPFVYFNGQEWEMGCDVHPRQVRREGPVSGFLYHNRIQWRGLAVKP